MMSLVGRSSSVFRDCPNNKWRSANTSRMTKIKRRYENREWDQNQTTIRKPLLSCRFETEKWMNRAKPSRSWTFSTVSKPLINFTLHRIKPHCLRDRRHYVSSTTICSSRRIRCRRVGQPPTTGALVPGFSFRGKISKQNKTAFLRWSFDETCVQQQEKPEVKKADPEALSRQMHGPNAPQSLQMYRLCR